MVTCGTLEVAELFPSFQQRLKRLVAPIPGRSSTNLLRLPETSASLSWVVASSVPDFWSELPVGAFTGKHMSYHDPGCHGVCAKIVTIRAPCIQYCEVSCKVTSSQISGQAHGESDKKLGNKVTLSWLGNTHTIQLAIGSFCYTIKFQRPRTTLHQCTCRASSRITPISCRDAAIYGDEDWIRKLNHKTMLKRIAIKENTHIYIHITYWVYIYIITIYITYTHNMYIYIYVHTYNNNKNNNNNSNIYIS